MKKIGIIAVLCMILAVMFQTAYAAQDISVDIDGRKLFFLDGAAPFLDEETDRVFVPVRLISEQMQMNVNWDEERSRIVVDDHNGKIIIMELGNKTAYVNGEAKELDAAPFIKDDSTYIPLRFMAENYGCDVAWDDAQQKVSITYLNKKYAPETVEQMNKILENVTGPEEFDIEPPRENGVVVSVADFGASPSASPEKNAEAFNKAVEEVKNIGATRLDIPYGIYKMRIERENQVEFKDITDLWIEGNGAELIFLEHEAPHSGAYFYFENCQRVKVHNLVFDSDGVMPLYTFLGTVKSVDLDNATVEFVTDQTIPDEFVFNGGGEWDAVSNNKVPVYSYEFLGGANVVSQEKTGEHGFSVTFKDSKKFVKAKPGDPALLKFKPNYNANGLNSYNCKNLSYDGITIYSTVYQAFLNMTVENLEYQGIKIIPREGRNFSTFGGCETHQVLGNVKMENCEFRGIFDDVMHMSNSFFAAGSIKVDDRTIILDQLQHYASKDYLYEGAVLSMRTEDFEETGWKSEIEEFEWQMDYYPGASAAHRCIVKFKDPLPDTYDEQSMFFNENFQGLNYIIRNNTIKDCHCHAFYYGLGNGLIENNTIENTGYPAIMLNTVLRWRRWNIGFTSGNTIIRNNHIIGCDKAERDPAIMFIGGGYDDAPSDYKQVKAKVTKNVLVENNTIEGSTWAALGMFSAENVVVRNNYFLNNNVRESRTKFEGMGNVYIYSADNIVFAGNVNENNIKTYENGLFIDEYTTNNITVDSNIGFGEPISMKQRTEKLGQQFDEKGDLIVPTGSFEFAATNGAWVESVATGYQGKPSLSSSSIGAECTFNPLLEGGKYNVYVYLVNGGNPEEDVSVTVVDKNGERETTLSCTSDGGKFINLGEYEFNEGKEGYVTVAKGNPASTKILRLSAVKFQKVE